MLYLYQGVLNKGMSIKPNNRHTAYNCFD